jgi:hypothetical protein
LTHFLRFQKSIVLAHCFQACGGIMYHVEACDEGGWSPRGGQEVKKKDRKGLGSLHDPYGHNLTFQQ